MEIPEEARALLWEYETGAGLAQQWEDAVLERVMQSGGWAEMRWLLGAFDRARLRMNQICSRNSRRLGSRFVKLTR